MLTTTTFKRFLCNTKVVLNNIKSSHPQKPVSRFNAKHGKLFFLSNSIDLQSSFTATKNLVNPTYVSPLSVLKSSIILPLLPKNNIRLFSNTNLQSRSWNVFTASNQKYISLNRFQSYRNANGNNSNSTLTLTLFGFVFMGVTFFSTPYLFEYVPLFTYFKTHPKEMVYSIIGLNLAVFGLWQVPKYWRFLQRYFLLEKDFVYSKWSLIGSAFSQQEMWHLGMNMLALWSFGTGLSVMVGAPGFFSLYMNASMLSSLFSLWYPKIMRIGMWGASLGASGALFGVFGCFAYLVPTAQILLFVFPIPGGAWLAFMGSVAWNAAGCILRWGTFDYAAHLGGSIMGILYGWYFSELIKKEREKRMSLLRNFF
ncbi:related to Rhomboid protein 1, mitochondrial [Saccharomycodes ludwigii]|uniref:Related to Rhomboid protein 1, mitochondrial n=1 Tax=Saccharomycodes ludwigii TaxID=36035 RepID=A0A376BAI4_9ASCO|nr:hypothetical protein SCDLUD_002314 [Saccharomycodes ludwigii]KAH3900859.1 hypothetical protein SCDLUD_002314 [Saccharomycodes ludwigii]SSD61611.1 related to Rhomboid protein 1, mitochondrial [Saccharomycodes ludwigii]